MTRKQQLDSAITIFVFLAAFTVVIIAIVLESTYQSWKVFRQHSAVSNTAVVCGLVLVAILLAICLVATSAERKILRKPRPYLALD